MESFISREQLAKTERQARMSAWILRILAAGMLVLFIVLCLVTRTANARTILWIMFISMTLLGWIWIGIRAGVERPAKAQARHLETLLSEEPEILEGVFRRGQRPVRIPKSVIVLPVTLESGGKTMRLNLDEGLAGRMPPDGSRIRVQTVKHFITGAEPAAAGENASPPAGTAGPGRLRRFRRGLAAAVPLCILWTMTVVIGGGFVFNRITDTAPKNKIVIFADCGVRNGAELADRLERQLADPVRMVKVYPFDYILFGDAGNRRADLYIVPASRAETYRGLYAQPPEELRDEGNLSLPDGELYGIPVFNPREAIRTACEYFEYEDGETYYLFFSNDSVHLTGNRDAEDNLAADAALALLAIP